MSKKCQTQSSKTKCTKEIEKGIKRADSDDVIKSKKALSISEKPKDKKKKDIIKW